MMTLILRTGLALLVAAAIAIPSAALAQQPNGAAEKPKAAAKPKPAAAKPAAKPAAAPQAAAGDAQPVLLGQYGDWGAYRAAPAGKKVCFALAKPASATTAPPGRPRDPSYLFVATRPAEKVRNEVSAVVGYPQKPNTEAIGAIGSSTFAMYTQNDGAWIKNAAEEAQMVEAMRKGSDLVVKSESTRGTQTSDTYSLKGLAQALDKVGEECK